MIPVQLTIEGLYSYQQRQTIQFDDLIDAGLFGIFGAVGSGKSSILEAITFALYGETERLNAREKRSYNMMNLKSNVSYIEFDFLNHEDKLFRITREFKRNSKRFEEIKAPTVVFYEKVNELWIPLDHSNAERIIGLSYANFKRTIIIPQGQFKEFIELGATDRTKMMKEIFNLHKYDLQENAAKLAKENQAELHKIEGKLQGFEAVSLEIIQENQNQLKIEEGQYETVLKEFNAVNESFQRLKALKLDVESLKAKKIQFDQLHGQKESMDQQQLALERYEKLYHAFHQLLIDQVKLQQAKKEDENALTQQQLQNEQIENQIKEVTLQLKAIQKDFEALADKRVEENDLELIIQNLAFSKEIEKLKERTSNGSKEVEKVQLHQKSIEEQLKLNEMEFSQLNQQRLDPQILMAVDHWFTKNNSIQEAFKLQAKKIEQFKDQADQLTSFFEAENINIDTVEADFEVLKENLAKNKTTLQQQKSEVEVQQKLAHFAHNLHDGEACPLCGSLEHPHIVEMNDVTASLEAVKAEIQAIEFQQEEIQKRYTLIQQKCYQFQLVQQQLDQEKRRLIEIEEERNVHIKTFEWKEFDANNFEIFHSKKEEALALNQTLEKKNQAITLLREQLDKARSDVEKFQKYLENFKLEEAEKASQIKQNISNLKILRFDDFVQKESDEVKIQLDQLKAFNQKTEKEYQLYQLQLNDLNPKLAAQQTSIALLKQRIEDQKVEEQTLYKTIEATLKEMNLESIDEVKFILDQKLDVLTLRKRMEEFRIQYETLKNSIVELEHKLENFSFDENIFEEQQQLFSQAEEKLKHANELVINRKTEIDRLSKAYEDKKEILEVQHQLQKRADLLKLFGNMFKGAGFVQYVSSIYLKQLCENANVRFHRMTRNQLSLQINENHDFEIIDYLNEGRPRSVKTLSGGQAFQVSLSLALALAESVQTNLKAGRNFFFIDEGFGTQDGDAVNIVFETLNHLHKENRIVGIISHVEELKERIPVALNIVKDEEKGSQIEVI